VFPPIFQILKSSQAIKDIVGTNPPRIYRHSNAPQLADRPYITWTIVSVNPENTLSELPVIDMFATQIDCWHQTDAGVELLAREVRDAMEPHCHMVGVVADLHEEDTRLFRIGLQFDFFLNRN
jgi:hypothetical protein